MHPDWGTYIFNYGRYEVRDFLLSSAGSGSRPITSTACDRRRRFDALSRLLAQGRRVDPNRYGGRENLEAIQFLKDLNVLPARRFPGVLTIAEESTAWGGVSAPVYNGGLGFSMKWDMGWMNDTLRYLRHEPVHRKFHQNDLSFRMVYAFTENFILPLSHDEVVHGKRSLISQMPGDYWQQFASLRLSTATSTRCPARSCSSWGASSAMDRVELRRGTRLGPVRPQYHDSLRRYVGDLNRVYRSEPAHLRDRHSAPKAFAGFRPTITRTASTPFTGLPKTLTTSSWCSRTSPRSPASRTALACRGPAATARS